MTGDNWPVFPPYLHGLNDAGLIYLAEVKPVTVEEVHSARIIK